MNALKKICKLLYIFLLDLLGENPNSKPFQLGEIITIYNIKKRKSLKRNKGRRQVVVWAGSAAYITMPYRGDFEKFWSFYRDINVMIIYAIRVYAYIMKKSIWEIYDNQYK